MALASVADLINRFDVRLLGQLATDDNDPLNATELASSTVVLQALNDASGLVISALYTAYKYNEDVLDDLGTYSQSLIERITCDLAFIYLAQRRGYSYQEKYPLMEESYDILQKLRNGERVLDVEVNKDAGNTATAVVAATDKTNANLITTKTRYFPSV